jgi:Tfp pilus assembly protein PilN
MSAVPNTSQSVRYTTNLIRKLRIEEQKAEQRQRLSAILGIGSFCFLALALVYGILNIWSMENVIRVESQNLERLQNEFNKYTTTLDIVDKADVEQLNGLQTSGIFWSKKLAALGQHLPDGYRLRSIQYDPAGLRIGGIAQYSNEQDELIELQRYLRKLEQDSLFTRHFASVRLTSARRSDDATEGMSFQFFAESKNKPR